MGIRDQLRVDAESRNTERRILAIDALLAIGPEAIPVVVKSLLSAGEMRWLIVEQMVLHGEALAPVFRQLLRHADQEIRILSAAALYTIGLPEGEDVLIDAIESGSWDLLAAAKLSATGCSRLPSALLTRLRTIPPTRPNEDHIAALLDALLKTGQEIPPDLRSRFAEIESPYQIEPLLRQT